MIARGIVFQPEQSIDIEPDALTLYDLSRFKNNGTMLGAGQPNAVQLPSGLWVWDYDGTNDQIDCGNGAGLTSHYISVEAWVNSSILWASHTNYTEIIGKNEDGVGGWRAFKYGTSMYFQIQPTAPVASRWVNWDGGFVQDTWYCFAFTYDGANIRGYCNGVQEFIPLAHAGTIGTTANNLLSGGRVVGRFFHGLIVGREIRNYALNAGQILNHYEKTKHLFGVHD